MNHLAASLFKCGRTFKLFQEKKIYIFPNSKFYCSKPKVLITRPRLPGQSVEKLKEECIVDIYETDAPMPKEELIKRIPGKSGLLCLITENIDKEILNAAGDQLKVISTMSAGYDHIDIVECKKRNILVGYTGHVNSNSVAEWTVMLMLNAGRRVQEAVAAVKDGKWVVKWNPYQLVGQGLEDSIVGIVGMGKIGQNVMKRVLPFGVRRVLYYDIQHPVEPAEAMGAIYADFNELVRYSDFIVSTCNLSDKTRNLFNKSVFDCMKASAVFINTSRGEVVNQDDLYDALKHRIRAAAIDVTVPEPLPQHHKLITLPNLIITPHIASSDKGVVMKMANLAAENLLLGVQGKPLVAPVPISQ